MSILIFKLKYKEQNIQITKRDNLYLKDRYGNTALMYAIIYNNRYVFDQIIKLHLNLDQETKALYLSVKHFNPYFIDQLLLTKTSVTNIDNERSYTLLMILTANPDISENDSLKYCKIFIDLGVNPNHQSYYGRNTALHLLMKYGNKSIKVKEILEKVTDITIKNYDGYTYDQIKN